MRYCVCVLDTCVRGVCLECKELLLRKTAPRQRGQEGTRGDRRGQEGQGTHSEKTVRWGGLHQRGKGQVEKEKFWCRMNIQRRLLWAVSQWVGSTLRLFGGKVWPCPGLRAAGRMGVGEKCLPH